MDPTISAGLAGLAGVLVTQGAHWWRARRQQTARLTAAEQRGLRDDVRDLRERLDHVEADAERWRDRYYEQRSRLGAVRMELAGTRAENEALVERVSTLLDRQAACRERCAHEEDCEIVTRG